MKRLSRELSVKTTLKLTLFSLRHPLSDDVVRSSKGIYKGWGCGYRAKRVPGWGLTGTY